MSDRQRDNSTSSRIVTGGSVASTTLHSRGSTRRGNWLLLKTAVRMIVRYEWRRLEGQFKKAGQK